MENALVYKNIIRYLPESDIRAFSLINSTMYELYQSNQNYIRNELNKRRIHVKIVSEMNSFPYDWEHYITVSRSEPFIDYINWIDIRTVELMEYDINKLTVLYHFQDNYCDSIEVYANRARAEDEFDRRLSEEQYELEWLRRFTRINYWMRITKIERLWDMTIYDSNNEFLDKGSSWRLETVDIED